MKGLGSMWTVQGVKLDGPNQGSKSRKISYRAFVHEKNRAKNLNRAKIVLLNC